MEKLKRISVLSFVIFQAVSGALIGLICGILYSFGGLIIDSLVSGGLLSSAAMSTSGLSYGTLLAFGAIFGMPVIFTLAGGILGLVEAVLFNLFAGWFGGIKIDFEVKE